MNLPQTLKVGELDYLYYINFASTHYLFMSRVTRAYAVVSQLYEYKKPFKHDIKIDWQNHC